MFRNTFFISDTHFHHSKVLEFEKTARPFSSIEEHNETIVQNWNSVVSDNDIVYHLGDVILGSADFSILKRLKGEIRLIPGNHDTDHKIRGYLENGVSKIMGYHEIKSHGFFCSHVPVHASQLETRFKFNIHGHTHSYVIPDNRYINVSCEQIGLTPIHLDEIIKLSKDRNII